jgi:energy-converting hydrogenase Eha subunit E
MTREKPVGWLAVSFLLVTVIGVEWCIRPHTAMLAIFSVFALTLVEGMFAKGSPLIYLMTFPLFLIWANIHSSVTAGLITLVIFIIYGMADVKLLIPALGGTLVNPQWIEIFAYSWRASSNPKITSAITEWFSPDFHLPWAMAAMILTLTVMLFIKPHWRKLTIKSVEISLPPVGITLILIGMFLYLKSVRHIAVLTIMIAAAIRVSDFGVPIRIKNQKKEREIEKIQLAIAMGLFMGTIILAAGNYGFHPLTVNIETALANDPMNSAVEFMKATGRTERILNDYDIGDYLIWHGLKPFIDGRADMYVFNKPEVWDDYIKSIFFEFEKPEAILDKYKIKHIVFRKDLPYAKYLRNIPGVKMVYENDEVVVFDYQRGKEFLKAGEL